MCKFNMIIKEFSREFEGVEIYPLNDLHIGDSHTDIELFQSFKKHILAKENRYVILIGDLMNNALKTSKSNVYDEVMSPRKQKELLIKELKEIKDRIIGITPGNHEERSKKDSDCDITKDIAIMLGLEDLYRDNGLFLKLSVGERKNRQRQITYLIHAIHGSGGGKTIGAPINNLVNYSQNYENIDIFIMGHVHQKAAVKSGKVIIDPRNNVIQERETLCMISGAWQDYGGYGMKLMLRPGCKGSSPIYLSGKIKEFGVKI